jgi:hypothetical protein
MEKTIVEQARTSHDKRLPDSVLNAPELEFGLSLYWDAFCDLDSCRPVTLSGIGPIPWDSVSRYAEVNEFDEEQTYLLHLFSAKMDHAKIEWCEKKNGQAQRHGKPGKAFGGPRRGRRG